MNWNDHARYRLELAEGFLDEARQDLGLDRFRSCVDNAQLSIENGAKAVIALFGPVGKTHEPWRELKTLLAEEVIPQVFQEQVERLATLAARYGLKEHFLTDYGDEAQLLSPWRLFGQEDAVEALETAETCFALAQAICNYWLKVPADEKQGSVSAAETS